MEKYGRARQATDGNIMRRMRAACWMTKAKNTLTEYALLIAFTREQLLRERYSVLRLYAHRLSCLLSLLFHNIDLLAIELRKQLNNQ